MALSCAYHRPALVRLVSLRDFGQSTVTRSRVAVAVLERSEAWTPASTSEAQPAAAAPLLSRADLLQQLTAQEREQVTHDVLRAFLSIDDSSGSNSSSSSSSHTQGGQPPRQLPRRRRQHGERRRVGNAGRPRPDEQQRGLQGQVVSHLLEGGFDEAMLEAAPTNILNWALKVLGQQGSVKVAEQLFHWMRLKGKANEHSFVKFCEACGAAKQPWRALRTWRNTRRMPQAATVAGTHAAAALICCYRSTADYQGALYALDTLLAHGCPVNRFAYNAAIRVCAQAGAADDALRLLGRLRQLAADQQPEGQGQAAGGPRPGAGGGSGAGAGSTHPWLSAAAGHTAGLTGSSAGSTSSSTSSSSTVAADGLHTDAFSYSAALAAIQAAGHWGRAEQLQRWMAKDGVALDAPLCTQLLSCYAALGRAKAAQQLLDGMLAGHLPRPNHTHWNALLLAYANARDAAGCCAAYRRMLGERARPDSYTMLALLRAAFHCQLGLPAVRAVQREMAARRVPLTLALGTAMLCCLRHVAPAPGPAMQLAPLLEAQLPDPQAAQQQQQQLDASSPAAGAQQEQQAGDQVQACVAEAVALFGRLRRRARRGSSSPLDLRAWNSLLLVFLAAGEGGRVLEGLEEMQAEDGLAPDDISLHIALAACQAGGLREREAELRRRLQGMQAPAGGRDGGGRQPRTHGHAADEGSEKEFWGMFA